MWLQSVLCAVAFCKVIIKSETEHSKNGYCNGSGLPCVNNLDCNASKCTPLSFYKELSNQNTSALCEENISFATGATTDYNYPILYPARIDLKAYTEGSKEEKERLIQSFDEYLHSFSTVSLFNHGIENELFDKLLFGSKRFFHTSLAHKMKYKTSNFGNSGYDPWKFVSAARVSGIADQPLDLTESFSRYNHDGENGEYGPPNCPNSLLNASNTYIEKISAVLKIVHEIAALSLGLDRNYFADLHKVNPTYHLRLFYYPELNLSNIEERAMRVSQHSDFLEFTLFLPGQTRGLQMKIDDLWIDVKTKNKYELVLNLGQFYSIWTNNYWKATMHRVIPVSKERFTVSFFTGTDQKVLIQQIKQCPKCMEKEAMFAPRMAKDHAKKIYSTARSPTYESDKDTFYT